MVTGGIERKLAPLRRQKIADTSPPEFELHLAGLAQKRADRAAGWRAGLPYAEFAEAAAALVPRFLDEVRAEYPAYEEYVGGEAA